MGHLLSPPQAVLSELGAHALRASQALTKLLMNRDREVIVHRLWLGEVASARIEEKMGQELLS